MKISKKLVKRVFKVAFVMSLSLVFIQNNTKAMEGTLGTDSNYTIQDGTKDDYSFRTYNINLENSFVMSNLFSISKILFILFSFPFYV